MGGWSILDGIVRLTAAVHPVNTGNPLDCAHHIIQQIDQILQQPADIVVFPAWALSGGSCGSMLQGKLLPDHCRQALQQICAATANSSAYYILGLPVAAADETIPAIAILYHGEIIAFVPMPIPGRSFDYTGLSHPFVPVDTVFACGDLRFCVLGCAPAQLPVYAASLAQTGCDLLIVPSYTPVYAGYIDQIHNITQAVSASLGCAVAVVNGGIGDTTSPWLYEGFVQIWECGTPMATLRASKQKANTGFSATVDLDTDSIRACKTIHGSVKPLHAIPAAASAAEFRTIRQNPWLPQGDPADYLAELFRFQVHSLVGRMHNIGIEKLVIGVSGGLDSTAALLVAAAACDQLGLPRDHIIGLILPGMGTSRHTHTNAQLLLKKIGATVREIPIHAAVEQHFRDIDHKGAHTVVFENAQARERAQVLLDVANQVGGFVVGTGDLSEEALGFSTFGGDHIANYHVNVCITKTVLRTLVHHIAKTAFTDELSNIVEDILATPISPELLPPSTSGEINQRTEDILGPYILHDFFLYYFIHDHFRPAKIFAYACIAFDGELSPAYIREKLRLFFQRFCVAQFKRSCAPDSASITQINLNAVHFYIPSDLDAGIFLQEIDAIPIDPQ